MRETWRGEAITIAEGYNARDIVDGTPEGNRFIGTELFEKGGNPADPDYRNGKTSWCGRFVEAVFHPLGFRFSLDSVGRVLSYAHYNTRYKMAGAPDCCRVAGEVRSLRGYHASLGHRRELKLAWGEYTPRPMDIGLHQNGPGSWHGHVFLVLNVRDNGDLTIIEGNHSQTIGPRGNKRDGIGTRVIHHGDPYLDWIVVPSVVDFDQSLKIGSMEQLEA